MPCYSVRPVGFPEREHDWLRSILTIGRGLLRDEWRWVTEGSADCYLVAADSLAHWDRYRAGLQPERLVACGPQHLELPEARWRVKRDSDYLPRLREVTDVLNALAADAKIRQASPEVRGSGSGAQDDDGFASGGSAAFGTSRLSETVIGGGVPREPVQVAPAVPAAGDLPEPARSPQTGQESTRIYDPREYLAGVIREAFADGEPRRLVAPAGGGDLMLEPGQGLFFVPAGKLFPSGMLSAPRRDIGVQPLSREALARETVGTEAKRFLLNDLIFVSVLTGSAGRLWAGCRADEPVRLRQWPNLKALPQYFDRPLPYHAGYIKLAAFMSGNTADIRTIAERTGTAAETVADFHNACASLDLLERGGEPSIRQKDMDAGVRDLYKKIARRLQG